MERITKFRVTVFLLLFLALLGFFSVRLFTSQVVNADENSGSYVIVELTLFPTEYRGNGAVFKKLGSLVNKLLCSYLLHRRSSNLLFSPSLVTFSTKSFMVAANFAPSAAETHSNLVLSFSIPR